MTKAGYYEMCEQLGTTPIPSEVPVDYSDFSDEVRTCLDMWHLLPSNIDSFSGNYYGKHLTNAKDMMDLFEVPNVDRRFYYVLLHKINEMQIDRYQKKKSKSTVKASPKG